MHVSPETPSLQPADQPPKVGRLSELFPVDIIRASAMFLVILLHTSIQDVGPPPYIARDTAWWIVNSYQTIARPGVSLFIMLTGFLLLKPYKVDEPITVFLKKRLGRLFLPALFWGAIYIAWGTFIDKQAFNFNVLKQDILNGPYFHFWFVYLIIGLYLLTPLLRVLITYGGDRLIKYLLLLWFIGVAVLPLASYFGYNLNGNVFVLGGWIGYFVLGAYLPKLKVRAWLLGVLLTVGFFWTLFPSHILNTELSSQRFFFFDSLSINVIMMSVALFMLLMKIPSNALKLRSTKLNTVVRLISLNTLPIYLFHIIVLRTLQQGLLGFTVNIMTLNPAIMVPLLALIILLISVAIIVALKKVPILKKLIG